MSVGNTTKDGARVLLVDCLWVSESSVEPKTHSETQASERWRAGEIADSKGVQFICRFATKPVMIRNVLYSVRNISTVFGDIVPLRVNWVGSSIRIKSVWFWPPRN